MPVEEPHKSHYYGEIQQLQSQLRQQLARGFPIRNFQFGVHRKLQQERVRWQGLHSRTSSGLGQAQELPVGGREKRPETSGFRVRESDSGVALAFSERGQQWNILGLCTTKEVARGPKSVDTITGCSGSQRDRKWGWSWIILQNSILGLGGFHWEDKWHEVTRAVNTWKVLKQLWNIGQLPWQR